MMIECCSQERTWLPYYGHIAQRFCMLHRRWQGAFADCFETNYNTIHRCGLPRPSAWGVMVRKEPSYYPAWELNVSLVEMQKTHGVWLGC